MILITTAFPAIALMNNINAYSKPSNNVQASLAYDWNEIQKLIPSDGAMEDLFGWSVSVSGDTALIGSHWDDDNGDSSGSAYIFTRSGMTWIQQQKLTALDGEAGDRFGVSVSLDGDTALIGAYHNDDNGDGSGSAYVFTRNGISWTQQAKLNASDAEYGQFFGISVSLDGDTALIGAYHDDDNGDRSGSAYVFTRNGTTWTQQQKLTASDGVVDDRFGVSVSLDGDTALIGAHWDDDNGADSGSAYVFTRSDTTWALQQKLIALDGEAGDHFGLSVSLDGDNALIGAHDNENNGIKSGSAYVFTRNGITWTQQQKLTALDGETGDQFGYSVSVDGHTALIGAYHNDDIDAGSGSAYVFTRSGTIWVQQVKLIASDGALTDFFGYCVSLSGDTAFIGAHGNNDLGSNSGSVYVFKRLNQLPYIPSNPNPDNNALDIDINTDLNWVGGDPDPGDIVTYDIYFGKNSDPPLHKIGHSTTIFEPDTLDYNTIYYWKIGAKDGLGIEVIGPIWQFTTIKASNNPPNKPDKPSGLANGKIGITYSYSSSTTDQDNDNIYYWFDWGDGTNSGWDGPYHSGDNVSMAHVWVSTGTFPVKVKAKDTNDVESVWSDSLSINMPKNKVISTQFFLQRLIHRFPLFEKILNQII
jgi:hypothetical protein